MHHLFSLSSWKKAQCQDRPVIFLATSLLGKLGQVVSGPARFSLPTTSPISSSLLENRRRQSFSWEWEEKDTFPKCSLEVTPRAEFWCPRCPSVRLGHLLQPSLSA
uniref:Uncharacterized protein n=1 Tax=Catharus ustulatus TaxID=91951 RepID=A0A8C3TW07_CATUS